jgi:hypothetical protein
MAAQGDNPKIVVSYRRTDSAMAGRIFDRLAQHFGKSSLFIDIDDVPFGVDFRKHIDDALQSSDLMIAVVGRNWVGAQGDGKARIENAADPVRVELETALRRNLNIIPVLLDGVSMPDPGELPASIQDFAYRNALEVEAGRDFNVHVERLIRAIEQTLGIKAKLPEEATRQATARAATLIGQAPPTPARRYLLPGIAGLLLAAAIGGGVWFWLDSQPKQAAQETAAEPLAAFCDDLKRVVFEARTQFTSILGPQQAGVWNARIQLPGWDDCTVSDFTYKEKTTRYYSCRLPSFKDRAEIDAAQNKLAAYVKPCLGPDFAERRARFSDQTVSINYEMGQNDPIVRLRMSHYEDTQEYVLRIDVDAPPPAPGTPAQPWPPAAPQRAPGYEGSNNGAAPSVATPPNVGPPAVTPPSAPSTGDAAGTQVPGVQVALGDSFDKVSAAYPSGRRTNVSDKPAWWAQSDGLYFFFTGDKVLEKIRLDPPYSGSVHGVKLGDSFDEVRKKLGEPLRSWDFGTDKANLYPFGKTNVRFDVNPDGKVGTMFVMTAN